METSLSILLPVHNIEATLHHEVLRVLEVAGELTDRLEVLIFDDGSTDQTLEVAHELAMCYPQINVVRHRVRRGLGPMIEMGLEHTAGDMVMVHDGVGSIDVAEITRLWQLRDDQPQVLHRGVDHLGGGPSKRRSHPFQKHRSQNFRAQKHRSKSFHMLRRATVMTASENEHAHPTRRHGYLGKLKEFALGE